MTGRFFGIIRVMEKVSTDKRAKMPALPIGNSDWAHVVANDWHADDKIYSRHYSYTVTYITKDPDDPRRDLIDDLPYCRFNRFFTSDNLNHFVYTIYA